MLELVDLFEFKVIVASKLGVASSHRAQKDEYGHRVQRIKIYYNFIGEIVIPDEYLQDDEDEDIPEQEETA